MAEENIVKQYDNPDPCVSILIIDDEDRVLLGLRGNSEIKPGKWCLPCGYIEGTETIEEAAKREVMEETGIEIEPVSIVNVTSNHFPAERYYGKEEAERLGKKWYTSLVVVILARPAGPDTRAGDDKVDTGWFDLDDLPDMAFKADLHIIGQYRKYGWDFGVPFEKTTVEFFEDE